MQPRLLALLAPLALAWPTGAASAAGDPIMPLSQVHAGMDCTGETVIQGTTISSFNVHVIDVVRQSGEGARILVRVSGPAVEPSGVAQGFSGAPVYCTDSGGVSRNVGAISEGIGEYGNKVALVTPIEQMLGQPVKPPSSAPRLALRTRALLGPLTVAGVSPWLLDVIERAGRRAGRTVVAAPRGSPLSFPPQALVPGASVATSYSVGDIGLGAVGTVTYRDGGNLYAFGHELDGAGRRSLFVQDAYVYDVINNPNVSQDTSYKLASPGHIEGTLTSDTPTAVIGQVGDGPPAIPVVVDAHDVDTGGALTLHTDVADETDIGLPSGGSSVDLIAPLSIAQAATQIYDGAPANQSGSMCLRLELRESSAPMGFCNRYVGTGGAGDMGVAPPALASEASGDVITALGLLDSVQFAALHVTRVFASIDARRGLAQALIVGARAPVRVRAGRAVRVQLTVRVYRGPLRTVSFALAIPNGLRGTLKAVLRGPSGSSSQGAGSAGLAAAITQSLGGPPGPSPGAPPSSIAALRKQIAAIARYDGLTVGFSGGGRRGGADVHAYRDPQLLIVGSAALRFVVR